MADRYPGYDVMAKRWTQSWNEATRRTIDRRIAIANTPSFFSPSEWETLGAVCERIMPQPKDRAPVPLPSYVDQKMAKGELDGYRYAQLPPQGEAWQRGLQALDAEAKKIHETRFHSLAEDQQDSLLRAMQKGTLTGDSWGGMPCEMFFEHRVIPDITHAYYAHPTSWNEIGFGGPASPRGYVRTALNRRDPWEPIEASLGDDASVRQKNARVR